MAGLPLAAAAAGQVVAAARPVLGGVEGAMISAGARLRLSSSPIGRIGRSTWWKKVLKPGQR